MNMKKKNKSYGAHKNKLLVNIPVHSGVNADSQRLLYVIRFCRSLLASLSPTGFRNIKNGPVADTILHVMDHERYPDAAGGRVVFGNQVDHFLVYRTATRRQTSDQGLPH